MNNSSIGNENLNATSVSTLMSLIQHWRDESGTLDGIIIGIFVLIGIVAVITNSLVLISVILNKNLRAPLDTAIASLSVIDIVTGIVGIPIIILVYQCGRS